MNQSKITLALVGLVCSVATSHAGFVSVPATAPPGAATITQDTRWTADNIYILRDTVYVLPPAILTIEPGTIVRGLQDFYCAGGDVSNQPGAIFICRGAKIIANGTPDNPIIFTSIDDPDVPGGAATIPASLPAFGAGEAWPPAAGPLTYSRNKTIATSTAVESLSVIGGQTRGSYDNIFAISGRWGGVVVLGRTPIGYDGDNDGLTFSWNAGLTAVAGDVPVETTATVAAPTPIPVANDTKGGNGVGYALIEGGALDVVTLGTAFNNGISSSTSFRPAVFGAVGAAANVADNSGVMRFCSHRYGGFRLGPDNELNGVTLGGCGSATVVEWQDVFQNKDDGVEWFGGFVNTRYLFTAFHGDDGYDGDTGYQGKIQYAFAYGDSGAGNSADANFCNTGRLQADASDKLFEWDGSEDNNLGVLPATIPIFYGFTAIGNKGIGSGATSTADDEGIRARRSVGGAWNNGLFEDLNAEVVAGEGAGTNETAVVNNTVSYFNVGTPIFSNANTATNVTALAVPNAGSNLRLKGTDMHRDAGGLDPRLTVGSALATGGVVPPTDGFLTPVTARAAMVNNNMLKGWTAIDAVGLVAAGNVTRPTPMLGVATGNPTISFAADTDEGSLVSYAIERSSDLRTWTPIKVITDGDAEDTDTLTTGITYKDSATTVGTTAVHYRVIPQ